MPTFFALEILDNTLNNKMSDFVNTSDIIFDSTNSRVIQVEIQESNSLNNQLFDDAGTGGDVSRHGVFTNQVGDAVSDQVLLSINGVAVAPENIYADMSNELIFPGQPNIKYSKLFGLRTGTVDGRSVFVFTSPIELNKNYSVSTSSRSGNGAVEYASIVNPECFTRDTMIDTDQGAVAVQDLAPGMMVRTRDNGMQPIRWIGMSPAFDRAVRIKAGALGNTRDLVVSPRHRMVLDGWQLKMLFSHDHALVTALELVNDTTIVMDDLKAVEYYHVMFDAHEVIFAEGAATESFHPDQASMGSMDKAARDEIFALFPELKDGTYRSEAAPNLSATQAAYVGKNLDAFVN
jgi:hypothetical protein